MNNINLQRQMIELVARALGAELLERVELVDEIKLAENEVQNYIKVELKKLLSEDSFEYAVQSTSSNNSQREQLIFERLENCI